jgi:hypothetical protein
MTCSHAATAAFGPSVRRLLVPSHALDTYDGLEAAHSRLLRHLTGLESVDLGAFRCAAEAQRAMAKLTTTAGDSMRRLRLRIVDEATDIESLADSVGSAFPRLESLALSVVVAPSILERDVLSGLPPGISDLSLTLAGSERVWLGSMGVGRLARLKTLGVTLLGPQSSTSWAAAIGDLSGLETLSLALEPARGEHRIAFGTPFSPQLVRAFVGARGKAALTALDLPGVAFTCRVAFEALLMGCPALERLEVLTMQFEDGNEEHRMPAHIAPRLTHIDVNRRFIGKRLVTEVVRAAPMLKAVNMKLFGSYFLLHRLTVDSFAWSYRPRPYSLGHEYPFVVNLVDHDIDDPIEYEWQWEMTELLLQLQ